MTGEKRVGYPMSMSQTKLQRTLSLHSIEWKTEDGKTFAYESMTSAAAPYAECGNWCDVTEMTLAELKLWLGY